MKRFILYIFLSQLLLAFICLEMNAQTPTPSLKTSANTETKSDSNLKLENLILLAHTAPPEVAADVLLTLAMTQPAITKTRKQELIEDAFRVARDAREPVKLRSWSPIVDTRSGLKSAAFELELDKLSLQSRAVTQMIALDKARARMMFQDIVLPPPKVMSCEDSLSDDPGVYFRTALAVSENCFDDNERKAEAHIQFLSARLDNIKSVSQVPAALKMLTEAKLSPDELSLLTNSLVATLGRISTDARAFAFAMTGRDRLAFNMGRLIQQLRQKGLPTTDASRAFRAFLVKQMTGEVCVDVPWVDGREVKLPASVTDLNAEFSKPIIEDDVRPASFGPAAKDRMFWSMPREKQLLMLAKDLRFGGGEEALTLEERQSDEWRKKMNDYLARIDSWELESGVSAEDFFQEKCILYGVLVDISPDDAQRDSVLRVYASYLREQNAEYKGRIEWILPVKYYLQRIRSRSEAEQRTSLDPWLSSSDAALRAYGELALLGVSKN